MYKILVPVGKNDDQARKQASYVASLPCAAEEIAVTLVHALTGSEKDVDVTMQQPDRVKSVRAAREVLEEADVDVETQGLTSPPAEGIVTLAEDGGFDEIVLAGRKRSPAKKAILGSVTQSVVLNATQPVTVVDRA
ncbi:universal stress protein [Haloplanus pelagicus]|jgi:nucleotide-binding universal stress UspA family protein|uniref:universal stress protein n=1 Tax=Haloplanus pelagicus TaxID=2949995 RepID=UPI00203BE7D4|nr:universal stress protein [Haloplanus sp. HW8-1]